jgi:hypothetical protein
MRKLPAKVMALLKTPSLPTKTRWPSMPDARKIGEVIRSRFFEGKL